MNKLRTSSRYFINAVLVAVALLSCEPVVQRCEISKVEDDRSGLKKVYTVDVYNTKSRRKNFVTSVKIIADSGKYNIGDTVRLWQ